MLALTDVTTFIKTWVITLLVLGTSGFCVQSPSNPGTTRSTDRSAGAFPVGSFSTCAQGEHNPSGNTFLNASGFQDGATLTLAQSGSALTATYVDQNGLARSLIFSASRTSTTARLAKTEQLIPGFKSLCVLGPGKQAAYPASMAVSDGTLTYGTDTVFLNVTGSLHANAGECGTLSESHASFWVVCGDGNGGGHPLIKSKLPKLTQLAGIYSCSTQLESRSRVNAMNHYAGGGGFGTLTLTAVGAKVTAKYHGDPSVSGTLRFKATAPASAITESGQTINARCMVPTRTGAQSEKLESLHINSGVVTLAGSTLFLSFAGSTGADSSCPGDRLAGSIICTKSR